MEISGPDVNPKVTVYIPTFNRVVLLRRAVESVLNQSYSNIELIVVDDGSTDGTVGYLNELSKIERRVRFFCNKVNSGACYSRNVAIKAARGEFVTGLDDDDFFLVSRIRDFLDAWARRSSGVIGLVDNSIIISKGAKRVTSRPKVIYQRDLLQGNYIGNQVFAKREAYLAVGGFDEAFPAWQDLELWYRLVRDRSSCVSCIKGATYVHDISHEHERISQGAGDRIFFAMQMFVEKHRLEPPESDFLRYSYAVYGFERPSLVVALKKIYYFRNIRSIREFILVGVKLLFSYFKS